MTVLSDPPPPEFVSDRLVLRRFDERDAPFVFDLHANPDLLRFIPKATMPRREDADEWIRQIAESAGPTRSWWCVTLHDGTPVGAVVLKTIAYSDGETGDEVEIGWRFHADFTGHGFATEAGDLLLAAGFAGGLDRIIAVVRSDNPASQTVAERIGLRPLGPTTRYYNTTIDHFDATPDPARARQVAWTGVDDPTRRDAAHVLLADGLRAFGRQTCENYTAAWTVDARDGWITRTVSVAVQGSGWRRTLALRRNPRTGEWSAKTHHSEQAVTALPQPGIVDPAALTEALDCDLGLCPLTNTMPIRRLHIQGATAAEHELIMAWIDMPSLAVIASDQIYTGIDSGHVRYTSGTRDFTAELTVDADGLVLDYPTLATRSMPAD